MRDILFRAKSAEDTDAAFKGQWAKGFLVQDQTGDMFGIVGGFGIIGKRNNGNNCFIAIDPETAGEYTGLKDKNGIEIFEGDICRLRLRCHDPELILTGKVCFETGGFWFFGSGWSLHDWHFYDVSDIEVIGNIHDNTKLLESNNEHGNL
ncbi:MAG: YopX family protein [Treponemataceae bacterium]|nr:MAG: YopX family protein [Treponemataceae bacterium]